MGSLGRERDRIDDRWVRVLGEYADDLNVRIGGSVRLIDDTCRGLAARYKQKSGALIGGCVSSGNTPTILTFGSAAASV